MVNSGLEPGDSVGWVQTKPRSYTGRPIVSNHVYNDKFLVVPKGK